ncbi:MAG: hypothetical protein A2826_01140 [Candidatus Doudnabacteria bacterium RIFCSPHIGHO2_01_FULL_43_23]|uniref:VanZ-like domain-containing protein n=1 Tax=Candidatus Doudnabacteria bacterium RIFCSPHIGHO2_01_FULL_43_23 TaxID=1817822 RepID=A0A1F5NSP2_9BACT|nr:MAG: hypothetical protein A2826_01140 [Candidatus Doudnabacteria bacterium RIFCSPHIGHO2_01_FULL_43_23]
MSKSKIIFWVSFAASIVLFFTPIDVGGKDGFGLDKVLHAIVFLILVITAFLAFTRRKVLGIVLLLSYAFAVEYIQGKYLPLRHFDWYDITADSIGISLGLIFSHLLKKY